MKIEIEQADNGWILRTNDGVFNSKCEVYKEMKDLLKSIYQYMNPTWSVGDEIKIEKKNG